MGGVDGKIEGCKVGRRKERRKRWEGGGSSRCMTDGQMNGDGWMDGWTEEDGC